MNLRRIISCKQMRSWNVLYACKFNNRGDVISCERPDYRLSRKIADMVEGFQNGLRLEIHNLYIKAEVFSLCRKEAKPS
jgi:hypothetical protein